MKTASSNDITDYILYQAIGGSRSKPIARLKYSQDRGLSFAEFEDIKTITFSSSNDNKQYNKFILVPPANNLSASFDNRGSKYSPGGTGAFANVLRRNLLIEPSFGYQTPFQTEVASAFAIGSYLRLYHTKIDGGYIKNDISSAASFNGLNGITDNWILYDSQNYNSGTYSPEGYWLSNIIEYEDLWGGLEVTKLSMDSDSDKIYVYYRSSDVEDNLLNDLTPFVLAGELSNGSNEFALSGVNERFFQFAIVFATGQWGTGQVNNIEITTITAYEYFNAGQFLVDRPNFDSAFGEYAANIECRDFFKKALETKVTCPSYSSSTDVAKMLRDVADRAGIPHNDGAELIADTGYTVTIADDENFKNKNAIDIFNEVMIYLNWKNNNYRLEMNIDGYLQLVIKESTTLTPSWQLDYRRNMLSINKEYESDKLLQRITVFSKNHTTETESQLASQTYTSIQNDTDLSWANESVYKRLVVTVNSGDGVFTLNSTENTKINFDITGTAINVTVTVYGCELKSSFPYVGESIYWNNAEFYDGITHKLTNRLIQSETEARDLSKSLTDLYGNPEFKTTVRLPYNPLMELGDVVLIWEKYTNTNTLYRIDEISLEYQAENASMYMSLKLTDLGTEFTNFQWDRENVIDGGGTTGDNDLKWDTGLIFDQDLGVTVTEDTADYDFLEPILAVSQNILLAEIYSSGTDANLDSPDDNYWTPSNLVPCSSDNLPFSGYRTYLKIGDYFWYTDYNPVPAPGTSVQWRKTLTGSAYGSIRFQPVTGKNWNNFAGAAQNGLKVFSLPKSADYDSLGGYFEYYYHNTAWSTAFNGNNSEILILQNGSVYKDTVQSNNLVVRWDGVLGLGGGGSFISDLPRPL